MSLYIPKDFAGDDAGARKLIAERPFAMLVTGAGSEPYISHLPLILDGGALLGHMARANPHWRQFPIGDTVAVFQGPHAFISRHWYPDAANNVPTWNFAAVHVSGKPELCDARIAVETLEARFEPAGRAPIVEEKMTRLVEGVVAFRLPLTRLDIKFKMSQNKPATEVASLVAGLKAGGDPEALQVAQWMADRERS